MCLPTLPSACLIIWIYIPIKVHLNLEFLNVHRNLWKNKYKKKTISKKSIFHKKKIGNQLKRTWHHMKAETLMKPCVKFEECRLNTLRENWICQKVNLNVNQERATLPSKFVYFNENLCCWNRRHHDVTCSCRKCYVTCVHNIIIDMKLSTE